MLLCMWLSMLIKGVCGRKIFPDWTLMVDVSKNSQLATRYPFYWLGLIETMIWIYNRTRCFIWDFIHLLQLQRRFKETTSRVRHGWVIAYYCEREWNVHVHTIFPMALMWRHNGRDGVSNLRRHRCLLNRLLRNRSKKISKLRVTFWGGSTGDRWIPLTKGQ